MNIVKKAGFLMLVLASINVIAAGSLFVTVPLVIAGAWIYLIGGLSA